MKKELTCIVCPVGCRLTVEENDGKLTVHNNQCNRGVAFGENEFNDPKRILTTTVKITGSSIKRLPVISTGEVPKRQLLELINELYKITVKSPVKRGDVIVKNIGELGVDIVASRTIDK